MTVSLPFITKHAGEKDVPLIEVDSICKSYKRRGTGEQVRAVNNVSFIARSGQILGLLGPNGAGKTTVIKSICGLIQPDSGKVLINGHDNQRARGKALRHISAVLEGNRNLYWRLSVRENMEYFAGNRGYSRHALQKEINRLLQFFALDDKANELVSNLSRGMQQKVAIAVAMIARTDAILLDEPTLGLDVPASFEVRSLLKAIAYEEGRNIIISTHDMPVVEDVCERVIIVNHGEIVVDDQTSNLLRLFEQHHFDITIAAPLSDVEQQALAHQFGHYEYRSDNQTYTLRIKFKQESDIYQLMDILKSTSIPIITIERKMPRFEDVFVGLLKESVKEPVL